jgi:uncharacterized protein (TIGR02996 family)
MDAAAHRREHLVREAEPFLRAIAAAPGDPLPRLIFADWLEEHGAGKAAKLQRHLAKSGLHPVTTRYGYDWPVGDAHFQSLLARFIPYFRVAGVSDETSRAILTHELFDRLRLYYTGPGRSRRQTAYQCETMLVRVSMYCGRHRG